MDHEEEFLNNFFTQVTQLCSDKAKELVVSGFHLFYCLRMFINTFNDL